MATRRPAASARIGPLDADPPQKDTPAHTATQDIRPLVQGLIAHSRTFSARQPCDLELHGKLPTDDWRPVNRRGTRGIRAPWRNGKHREPHLHWRLFLTLRITHQHW